MNRDEIIATVKSYLMDEFLSGENPAEVQPPTRLVSSGMIDSLSMIKLVEFVERRFEIEVLPSELNEDTFDTLDAIADLIGAKLARR